MKLWNLLLDAGREYGIMPCGLGARDTLRTEAGLPLHGHELRPDLPAIGHPWEFAMDFESDFLGKDVLVALREKSEHQNVIPFLMQGRRKAMHGWEVLVDGAVAGQVLSGVISPTLENAPIGFAEVDRPLEEAAEISFRQPGRDAVMSGKVAKIPFVPLTSRKKLAKFL